MQTHDFHRLQLDCRRTPLQRRAASGGRSALTMPVFFAVALSMVLAGCTVGPNFVHPIPLTTAHWSSPRPRPVRLTTRVKAPQRKRLRISAAGGPISMTRSYPR